MTVQTLAIVVLLVSFFVMIFLRFPIAYAVGLSSVLCMMVQGQALTDVCRLMVKGISSFSLMAVPFFITMGVLMGSGGISEKLIALADACVGWMRGGMAMVNIVASYFFGGISGSASADTASIGSIMIPMMVDQGYDADFSTAVTITSSCEGLLVPPSHNMVIYATTAGGISVDGWKMLWKYCNDGVFTGDNYGFDPLNRGDVQVSTFYSSSLYGKIDSAADSSSAPLTGTTTPENWGVVDIDDGTYYIAEYIGILDRADRTPEQTEAVKAFAEWFGSAETQTEWSDEFDSFPCNEVAVKNVYGDEIPASYQLKNCALEKVEGTDMTYAEYVAAHSKEWTNIMTNLGFYWADASQAPAEPDWDNVNWAVMTQAAQ